MGRENRKIVRKDISISKRSMVKIIEEIHDKKMDVRFKANGNSMTPAIKNGDIITLSPVGDSRPGPGEVSAYRRGYDNELIIHRIIKVSDEKYSIRGDNSNFTHQDINVNEIIGVVTGIERNGRSKFWPGRYNSSVFAKVYFHIYLKRLRLFNLAKRIRNKFFN